MTDNNNAPRFKRTEPIVNYDNPDFVWTAGADVQATWRRFGWVPPTELKNNGKKPEGS